MSKGEEIAPHGDERHVRRDNREQFKRQVDQGRSLSADGGHEAKREAKPGEGDKGDRGSH